MTILKSAIKTELNGIPMPLACSKEFTRTNCLALMLYHIIPHLHRIEKTSIQMLIVALLTCQLQLLMELQLHVAHLNTK